MKNYDKKYPWINKLSKDGKELALKKVKLFESLNVAVPSGIIYRKYKDIP